MSPEDKLKRAAIFKKMALRDKLEASRKRHSLGVLRDELSKTKSDATSNKSKSLVTKIVEPEAKNFCISDQAIFEVS